MALVLSKTRFNLSLKSSPTSPLKRKEEETKDAEEEEGGETEAEGGCARGRDKRDSSCLKECVDGEIAVRCGESVKDWREGADGEEGDEFAGEPDYAAVGMVSGELLRVLTSVWMVCWLWWGRSSHLR